MTQSSYWDDLVRDLEIEVVRPFTLELTTGPLEARARVCDFGAPNGMLIFDSSDVVWPHREAVLAAGFGWSSFDQDGQYDRANAINMLVDWGWMGTRERRPRWYRRPRR